MKIPETARQIIENLAVYSLLPEPTSTAEMMVYTIQSNTLIFKIDTLLTRHERETGDELMRLFIRRHMLREELARLRKGKGHEETADHKLNSMENRRSPRSRPRRKESVRRN